MNEQFLRTGQLKSEIEDSINKIFETSNKSVKFENPTQITVEIANLKQTAEAIKQKIIKFEGDVTSLRVQANSSIKVENANIWKR